MGYKSLIDTDSLKTILDSFKSKPAEANGCFLVDSEAKKIEYYSCDDCENYGCGYK